MSQGTPPIKPRHTEEVARETTLDLAWECMKLMRSTEPQAWELAAKKFDECADACRIAEAALARRKAAQVLRPECPIHVVEVCMYDSIPHLLAAMQTRSAR